MNVPNEERLSSRDAGTPWQLWVVIVLLAVEGMGNLVAIAETPIAAAWLVFKVLTIVGFIRKWKIMFVLFVVSAAVHVMAFVSVAPFVAFLNLVILMLALSQIRRFFPRRSQPVAAQPVHGTLSS